MNALYGGHVSPFYPTSEEGYLKPLYDSIEDVSEINRMILQDIIDHCEKLLDSNLLSIYFRGSQLIFNQFSDFDVIVIIANATMWDSQKLSEYLNRILIPKFSHLRYFDCLVIKQHDIDENRQMQFVIKVLSLGFYGDPLHFRYEGFRPGSDCIFLLKQIDSKIELVKKEIYMKNILQRKNICNYLIKFLIRSSLELVIEREKRFTRDLYHCHRLFARYYPQHEGISLDVLNYYDLLSFGTEDFISLIVRFSEILKLEYRRCQLKNVGETDPPKF